MLECVSTDSEKQINTSEYIVKSLQKATKYSPDWFIK